MITINAASVRLFDVVAQCRQFSVRHMYFVIIVYDQCNRCNSWTGLSPGGNSEFRTCHGNVSVGGIDSFDTPTACIAI